MTPPSDTLPTSAGQTLWRGARGRCPRCGHGRLFARFLKVVDRCATCGEELHHHRADDFPAYCTIFAVGHVLVPLVLAAEIAWQPPMWLHAAVWMPAVLVMSFALLPFFKGGIVALQWYSGMHGFASAHRDRQAREHMLATGEGG